MTRSYKHLFFDLDHTLWDHHRNANETLTDIYQSFNLNQFASFNVDQFQYAFHKINHALWQDYHLGLIVQEDIRKERFRSVLDSLGVEGYSSCDQLSADYLHQCPSKSNLMPYTLEVLKYLKDKKYSMTIITNGFSDIQDIKMNGSGLQGYFDRVITSNQAGWLKPHKQIFDFAVKQADVAKSDCLMVGDNLSTDIEGARNAGIDQVFYDYASTLR